MDILSNTLQDIVEQCKRDNTIIDKVMDELISALKKLQELVHTPIDLDVAHC